MTHPQVRAWFSVTGFECDPEAISTRIGFPADQSWKAGQGIGGARTKQPEAGWRIRSRLTSDGDVNEHARWLLERLPDQLDTHGLGGDVYLQFSFAIDVQAEMPAISFAPGTITRIAMLGAAIDVDLYVQPLVSEVR